MVQTIAKPAPCDSVRSDFGWVTPQQTSLEGSWRVRAIPPVVPGMRRALPSKVVRCEICTAMAVVQLLHDIVVSEGGLKSSPVHVYVMGRWPCHRTE